MDQDFSDEDMAAVGRALMHAISAHAYPGWRPADCPSEIVGDLRGECDELRSRVAKLEAELRNDHWPWGATVKLVWEGGGMNYRHTFGWAKRDASGALVSAYSLAPLNPDDWEVVEERRDQSAETLKINDLTPGDAK